MAVICLDQPIVSGREVLLQSLPALEIFVLQDARVHGELGGTHHELRLKHEGQRVGKILRLQLGIGGALEGLRIGAVAGHAVVQAGAAGHEALGLGVVRAEDQAHELVHQVAMKPGRAEGVLGHHPARGEDGEVAIGRAGNQRGRGEHGVDGWVGMVEGDGVDAVEQRQVVLVGRVVAVPADHVERRVIDERGPEPAEKFRGDVELAIAIFIRGNGREEIARIGEAVGADGAQLRQAERQAVVLADVTARLLLLKHNAELDAARDHADLARRNVRGCRARCGSAARPAAAR